MNKLTLFLLCFVISLVFSVSTNCNGSSQGNSILSLDDSIVFDLDDVETEDVDENCKDAYVCKISCTCPNGKQSYGLFRLTTDSQLSIYNSICTTRFADAYLTGLDSVGNNFHIEKINAFFNDNTFANSLKIRGIKEPIAVTLKNTLVSYLRSIEPTLLTIGDKCCKPDYKSAPKFRTLFFVMALKLFNSYADLKEACEKSGKKPEEEITAVFTKAVAGKPYDLLRFSSTVPQINGVRDLLLKVYKENKENYCDCNAMVQFAKSQNLPTSSFETVLASGCKC